MTRWIFARSYGICWISPGVVAKHHLRTRVRDPRLVRSDRLTPRDHCSVCKLPEGARVEPLVVEATVFHDARAVAFEAFHTTELRWEETCLPAEMVVAWSGHDAGRVPGKSKMVTRRT